ncbi:MAG: DUF434 domain-containing protein [Myxococcota bacterium]
MAGAHPEDARALAERDLSRLRAATYELSWLLSRGYADGAALSLVGNKHQLGQRQRMMVRRCSATEAEVAARRSRRVEDPSGWEVAVDGFNQLVTTERGLAGGAVLRGRDGVVRDVASVHGTWRRSERTDAALDLLVEGLQSVRRVVWILDAPVSNSGRLAGFIRSRGDFEVRLEASADRALASTGWVVATSDGPLIEKCPGYLPLAELALRSRGIEAVDLGSIG